MISRPFLASLAISLCAAAPAAAYDTLPSALAGLSPADFAQDIHIVDDPLASAIVVSTREGYTRTRSLQGGLADDVHLRALIDRSTGKITWQVWHDIAYVGGRKAVDAVHYQAGGAVREARPFHVTHRVDRCPPTDAVGHCGEAITIGFELSEATVREIAAAYAPGSRAPWPLRFKDTDGRDVTGGLAPAEAAGILHAVESWKRERG
jgi:hypothetical protein